MTEASNSCRGDDGPSPNFPQFHVEHRPTLQLCPSQQAPHAEDDKVRGERVKGTPVPRGTPTHPSNFVCPNRVSTSQRTKLRLGLGRRAVGAGAGVRIRGRWFHVEPGETPNAIVVAIVDEAQRRDIRLRPAGEAEGRLTDDHHSTGADDRRCGGQHQERRAKAAGGDDIDHREAGRAANPSASPSCTATLRRASARTPYRSRSTRFVRRSMSVTRTSGRRTAITRPGRPPPEPRSASDHPGCISTASAGAGPAASATARSSSMAVSASTTGRSVRPTQGLRRASGAGRRTGRRANASTMGVRPIAPRR